MKDLTVKEIRSAKKILEDKLFAAAIDLFNEFKEETDECVDGVHFNFQEITQMGNQKRVFVLTNADIKLRDI